jgi:hypothetical protein
MPIEYDERGKWKFAFIPEYADCIARVASIWARLEYDISVSIWQLADVRPALGACMTSQIYTLGGRLDALLSLAKLRNVPEGIIKGISKFADDSRDGQEIRDRIIHDQWVLDKFNPGTMGHLRITAAKKLDFNIKTVILPDLAADLEKLEDLSFRFHAIRDEIEAALPTLPKIPHSELHPITKIR